MNASAALAVGMLAAGACGMNPGPSPGPDAGGGTGSGSGSQTACGDGHCDPGETAATCPADCRPPGPTCGNHVCEAGETTASCPADCSVSVCGDSVCQAGETATSCPQDCTAILTTKNTSTHIVNHLFVYPCGQTAEGTDQLQGGTILTSASASLTGIPPGCYLFHATSDAGVQWRDADGVNLIGAEHFTWTLTN